MHRKISLLEAHKLAGLENSNRLLDYGRDSPVQEKSRQVFIFKNAKRGGGGRALSSQVVGQGSEEREITRYVNAAHAAECREKSSSHRAKANSEQLQ